MIKLNRRKFCECGCGIVIKRNRRFVPGHNSVKNGCWKPKTPPQLCACGCGEMTKPGSRYINGHNGVMNKGKKRPDITGEKHRYYGGGKKHPAYGKVPWNKGLTKETNESMRKVSVTLLGNFAWNTGLTKETDERVSKGAKNMKGTKGRTNKHNIGIPRPDVSIATKKLWQDSEYRAMMYKLTWGDPEFVKKHIDSGKVRMKRLWSDLEWKEKQLLAIRKGLHIHPNKPETTILSLLNKLYPEEWKYTGDRSFIINGKNPDFVNCNGQKKIIEFNGDYWHRNDIPGEREKIFAEYGWDTLVIWEKELKDMERVKFRIHRFHRRENIFTVHKCENNIFKMLAKGTT